MNSKTSNIIFFTIIAGVILGGISGYYLPEVMLSISFIGQLFLNALKIIIIPLIVASLIVSVNAMGDINNVKRTIGKILLYFLSTSIIAICIGLILVYIIQPGANISTARAYIPSDISQLSTFSFSKMIASIIPESFLQAITEGQFLGIIIFSIFFGVVVSGIGVKGKTILDFFQGINNVILRLVKLILYAAPVGLFSLVGTIMAQNVLSTGDIISSLLSYSLTLIIAFAVHTLIVLPLILKYFANRSPFDYLGNTLPAISTALGTGSSAATLPITYDCVIDRNKVDNRAGSLTLSLGAMVNMNGTAIYLTVAALFIAQVYQVSLSLSQVLILAGTALFISIGSSVIPHISLLMLAVILNVADFPPRAYAGIGLLFAVDWFFDRWRTAANVWGDAVGAAVVGESFDFKTARKSTAVSRRPVTRSYNERYRQNGKKVEGRRTYSTDRKRREGKPKGKGIEVSKSPRHQTRNKTYQKKGKGRPPQTRSQKIQQEKPSPFTLPPVPYHILEKELHHKRESKDIKTSTEQKSITIKDEKNPNNDTFSKDTIKRERAKIAAQLADMKEKEKTNKRHSHSTISSVSRTVSDQTAVKTKEDDDKTDFPKFDFYSGDSDSEKVSDNRKEIPEMITVNSVHEKTDNMSHTEAKDTGDNKDSDRSLSAKKTTNSTKTSMDSVKFGRSKPRRSHQNKNKTTSNQEPDANASEDPGYSVDNISFGRRKRKK